MEGLSSIKMDNSKQNIKTISMLIKGLCLGGEPEKALEICNHEEWKDDLTIIAQKNAILISFERYPEAFAECTLERCQKHEIIANQRKQIIELMKNKDNSGKKEENTQLNGLNAVFVQIKALTFQGEHEEAIVLCEQEPYKDNLTIIDQKIKAYMLSEQLLKALAECTEERCAKHEAIAKKRDKIQKMIKRRNIVVTSITEMCTNNAHLSGTSDEEVNVAQKQYHI